MRVLLFLGVWLLATTGVATAATVPATVPGAPPPLEAFFGNPGFSGAAMSPDAHFLAVRTSKAGGRDMLAVVELATMAVKIIGSFSDADIGAFMWVNSERLVFTAADKTLAQGEIDSAPGLFAVNRDGTRYRQLAERHNPFIREQSALQLLPWNTFMLRQRVPKVADSIYVVAPQASGGELRDVDLLLLNTVTGRSEPVQRPPHTRGFLLDEQGELRIASGSEGADAVIWYRDPKDEQWRELARFDRYAHNAGFMPLSFGPDGTLYVTTRINTDKAALYRFDFSTGKVSPKPVLQVADFDFNGSIISGKGKLLGVSLNTDAPTTEWFDADMKALQARIDARLPVTVNQVSVPSAQSPWVLVQSQSDVQPTVTRLFNTETGAFNKVGDAHSQIDPRQMGRQDLVHYKARDGRAIPAWLTLPHGGGKNLPMVVLVHGGPYVRGHVWGWNAQAQFLASRGYAVLEPEFRGSTGYGFDHFKAGWKQWGLAMQNDIADGTRWAIAGGVADPRRICIAGASYGGYATLMGLVNDPELYRCGIDWVGVTDIDLLFSGHWSFSSDLREDDKKYGLPVLIGDPKTDHAQFQATSPLAQAARITQPLLLAYGGADRRVPMYHGQKFYDAVKASNHNVEFIRYDDEGHGWALPKTRYDFWTRVERFLDKNIGEARAQ